MPGGDVDFLVGAPEDDLLAPSWPVPLPYLHAGVVDGQVRGPVATVSTTTIQSAGSVSSTPRPVPLHLYPHPPRVRVTRGAFSKGLREQVETYII